MADATAKSESAKANLEGAKAEAEAKRAETAKKQHAYMTAQEKLAIANRLNLKDALETPITEDGFTYLNDYVEKVKTAQANVESAQTALEQAKLNTADKKTAYETANAKHIEAVADLAIAKANYQKFLDEEEVAKKAEKQPKKKR